MTDVQPRVTDNDSGEITVTLDGQELRGWSYKDDAERRVKMGHAREYVEGWCDRAAFRCEVQSGDADLAHPERLKALSDAAAYVEMVGARYHSGRDIANGIRCLGPQSPTAAQAVQEPVDITGWKLVPDDPTEAMWQAGRTADLHPGDSYSKVWRAMFEAAPDVDDCETTSNAAQTPTVGVLHDIYITMRHARTFITSREKMHPTGVELWDRLFAQIEALQASSVPSAEQS